MQIKYRYLKTQFKYDSKVFDPCVVILQPDSEVLYGDNKLL